MEPCRSKPSQTSAAVCCRCGRAARPAARTSCTPRSSRGGRACGCLACRCRRRKPPTRASSIFITARPVCSAPQRTCAVCSQSRATGVRGCATPPGRRIFIPWSTPPHRRRPRLLPSTITHSSPCRATACTKSRSGPCTRESSNRAISAFRWSARKCCGWKSASATFTKESSGASPNLKLLEGHRLAARVSGDSAAAYSWAYCQALESMAGAPVPQRAVWLRAFALELERLANHLGDLGALGNDAGFALGLAQFSRLKEQLLRATTQSLGQRYLMDLIVPGGTRVDLSSSAVQLLADTTRSHRRASDHTACDLRRARRIARPFRGRRRDRSGSRCKTRIDRIRRPGERPRVGSSLRSALRAVRRAQAHQGGTPGRGCRGARGGALRRSARIGAADAEHSAEACRPARIMRRSAHPAREPLRSA